MMIFWSLHDALLVCSGREGLRRADDSVRVIKDESVAIVDCGASSTLTRSLINATNAEEKVMIIEMVECDERL